MSGSCCNFNKDARSEEIFKKKRTNEVVDVMKRTRKPEALGLDRMTIELLKSDKEGKV